MDVKVEVEVSAKLVAFVVDDDEMSRRMVEKKLLAKGYVVYQAKDGIDAREKLKLVKPPQKIDLFVVDNEMGGVEKDGSSLIIWIKQQARFRGAQIIGRSSIFNEMKERTLAELKKRFLNTEQLQFISKTEKLEDSLANQENQLMRKPFRNNSAGSLGNVRRVWESTTTAMTRSQSANNLNAIEASGARSKSTRKLSKH